MNLLNNKRLLAGLAGLLCVFGFAPFGIFPIPVLALAVLFILWGQADTPRIAAALSFYFGLGLFVAGVGWIYVSLHDFGEMPMWLAAPATLLFAAFLSLFLALAGHLQARFSVPPAMRFLLVMPAIWVAIEWLRGMIFTGFPWLTLGYAHSNSPLAGYAPLFGVYGVSLIAAVAAGLLAILWHERGSLRGKVALGGKIALAAFFAIWVVGALLRNIAWTQAEGVPFSVTMVQGNVSQDIKFNDDVLFDTLETYRRLVIENPARLTILPETALPMFRDEVPENLINQLREHGKNNNGDVLTGVFEQDRAGYYNSVIALGASENHFEGGEPHYRKHHLVIFGEFIPLRPIFGWIINQVLNIPMGDLSRGEIEQAPLHAAGQRIAVSICYEDVFGEEIIKALPEATLLVNVTNDGWFGHSHAAAQHNQISQLRALETGRMMLRATNTGVTSIIGIDGRVQQQLPQHQLAVLHGEVKGYSGITPYVRWGNGAVLLFIAMMLAYAWRQRIILPSSTNDQ